MLEKQKIFFVYPPSPIMNRADRCQQPTDEMFIIPPIVPFDMMMLSTIAKKRGYDTKFKDYSLSGETAEDFINDLKLYNPDFLVLNVASTTLENDLSILKKADENNLLDDVVVVVKGAIFNFNSYSIMQNYPEIDVALRGEIEGAFDEIIQYKNFSQIDGITYQINNKIISTKNRALSDNINHLPMLDRDIIDNNIYIRPDTKKPQTVIVVSKGCPNNCFFCLATNLNGKIVRYRSEKLIVNEIMECIKKYGIYDFIFWSDVFNLNKTWIQNLCSLIIEKGLKINFSTNSRADCVDFETLQYMKAAGCNLISLGVESGSQEILDNMGKRIYLDKIMDAVDMIEQSGIQTYAYYVLGLPWETKKTIEETFRFAKKLNTHYASFFSATALMGTRFYDYIIKNRLGEINYEMPYLLPSIDGYELKKEEIYEYNRKFNRKYYLRFRYIFKMLFTIDSIQKLKTYFDMFLKLINLK